MKYRSIALSLAALLVLSACKGAPAATPTPAPPSATPAPIVSAPPTATPTPAAEAPVWGEQVSECAQADEADPGQLLVSGRFSLPRIENADGNAAYAAINDWYLDLSAGLRSDTLSNAPFAADDYAVSKAEGYAFTPYSDEETFAVKHETARMVSILRTHYGHTGGVYPTVLYLSDHFDLGTGARLGFADFFTDPDAAAARIMEEVLRQDAAAEAPYGADVLSGVYQREQFYWTQDSLVAFFQPGDLGAHAAGAPEYAVPRELLADLLADWG